MDIIGNSSGLFSQYRWELFITSRPPPNMPVAKIHDYIIKNVFRPIAKITKETLGCITIILPATKSKHLHCHSAVLSKNHSLMGSAFALEQLKFDLHTDESLTMRPYVAVDIIPFRHPDPTTTDKDHPSYLAENIAENENYLIHTYGTKLLFKELYK